MHEMTRDYPRYLSTHSSGRLAGKISRGLEELSPCRVCPRECPVDRLSDEIGVCRTGRHARVSSAFAHHGEEDVLRGWRGSGTVFFSYCNLKCVFCQNYDISWRGEGRVLDAPELAGLMLALQERGCHNLNLVTPEHVVPQILEALPMAIESGLNIPIVYNTSGYDSLTSLELLDGIVDIYMPDFKVWDPSTARRLLLAEDYPSAARAAIVEMHRQVGDLEVDENGLAVQGLLVRHLVMPGGLAGTREIMRFLAQRISGDTYVNIMGQYHPAGRVGVRGRYPEINRPITAEELREAYRMAVEEGLTRFDERAGHAPLQRPLW